MVEDTPSFMRRVRRINRAHGSESIELKSGRTKQVAKLLNRALASGKQNEHVQVLERDRCRADMCGVARVRHGEVQPTGDGVRAQAARRLPQRGDRAT